MGVSDLIKIEVTSIDSGIDTCTLLDTRNFRRGIDYRVLWYHIAHH